MNHLVAAGYSMRRCGCCAASCGARLARQRRVATAHVPSAVVSFYTERSLQGRGVSQLCMYRAPWRIVDTRCLLLLLSLLVLLLWLLLLLVIVMLLLSSLSLLLSLPVPDILSHARDTSHGFDDLECDMSQLSSLGETLCSAITPCGGEVLHVCLRCHVFVEVEVRCYMWGEVSLRRLARNARCNTMSHLAADACCSYMSHAKCLMLHHVTPHRRRV